MQTAGVFVISGSDCRAVSAVLSGCYSGRGAEYAVKIRGIIKAALLGGGFDAAAVKQQPCGHGNAHGVYTAYRRAVQMTAKQPEQGGFGHGK